MDTMFSKGSQYCTWCMGLPNTNRLLFPPRNQLLILRRRYGNLGCRRILAPDHWGVERGLCISGNEGKYRSVEDNDKGSASWILCHHRGGLALPCAHGVCFPKRQIVLGKHFWQGVPINGRMISMQYRSWGIVPHAFALWDNEQAGVHHTPSDTTGTTTESRDGNLGSVVATGKSDLLLDSTIHAGLWLWKQPPDYAISQSIILCLSIASMKNSGNALISSKHI